MQVNNIEKIIKNLTEVFFKAGNISIELRNKGLKKHIKEDKTPVTNGDIEVNKIILDNLKNISPDIPIISEETAENKNKNLNTFWLVDPIDGTYDYINNKDEFTLNACLWFLTIPGINVISNSGWNLAAYAKGNAEISNWPVVIGFHCSFGLYNDFAG